MSKLMQEAYARRRALEEGEDEAPRRPGPIGGPPRAPAWMPIALALVTVGVLVLLFKGAMAPPAPLAVEPAPAATYEALNAAPAPTSPWVQPEPTAAPAPTAEPVAPPTAAPAVAAPPPAPEQPPQAAPMAPASVYAPPAPTVDIFANPSDLIPDTGLGEREKPCTHPSCEVAP